MGKYDDDLVTGPPPAVAPAPAEPGVPRITVTPRANKYEDDLPPPRKEQGWGEYLKEGAGAFVEGVGHYGSFGMLPRIDAVGDVVTGRQPDYSTALEARNKRREGIAERSPYASMGGNVVGGVGGGIAAGGAKIGANIAGRAAEHVPMWLAKAMGFGTEGAIVGAGQGAGNTYTGKPEDYAANAGKAGAMGGVLGAAGGQLVPSSAVQMRAGNPATGQPIVQPTEQQLRALSDRGYQQLRQIPVTYPGSHLQGTLSQAESRMMQQGVAPEQAQTVMRIIERMRNHPGSISPAEIDGVRQSLNNMKNMPTVGSEKAGVAAAILRDTFDDMIQNGAGAASNPQLAAQAARVVERARGDRAAMFRSQQMTGPAANAANTAARGGPPVGEKLGPASDKLLKWERGQQPNTRGWVDEERARLAAAVTPTFPERAAKFGADYLSRDIPALAGGKVAGDALRGYAARGVEGRWDAAAQAMRGRSPAYQHALRGAVPVAGPGMGMTGQGIIGAGATELGTPYSDGRAALVEQLMRQGMTP